MQRKSMIYTTLVRLTFFPTMLVIHVCSVCTSIWDPQLRPLAVHEISLMGGLDMNSGIAAQLVRHGSVL